VQNRLESTTYDGQLETQLMVEEICILNKVIAQNVSVMQFISSAYPDGQFATQNGVPYDVLLYKKSVALHTSVQ
jgi:hypothetical protein